MGTGDKMRYFANFLIVLSGASILLMPAWISWVSRASWPLPIKKITVIIMAIISATYTVIVISKPNIHINTRIIGSIIAIIYLLIVFVAIYYSWPKMR
jgi:hypothetical protein